MSETLTALARRNVIVKTVLDLGGSVEDCLLAVLGCQAVLEDGAFLFSGKGIPDYCRTRYMVVCSEARWTPREAS